ncbi:HAAS signaling domain-containing protein [Actinoplanes sp. CA-142083]|uniref:HAAS signaling domain-containing protein n=1 Tax=Actinoplanes sp. CA-142083 TaxID=3239903 RepID=UPI003D93FD81
MNDEINAYVEAVERSLAGIANPTRAELLEDLPEHLAEVQAEGTGTLRERLGAPEAYASELLASAGLVGGFPEPPPARLAELYALRDQTMALLDRADVKVGPVIGYEKASQFLVLLRPGWWVLRGYLLAMALAYVLSDGTRLGLLPRIGNNEVVALVLLAGCVIVSIVLGHRTASLSRLPRLALRSSTVVLVIFALAGFVSADDKARDPGYSDANYQYTDQNPYSNVNDVYVYDSQGRLVPNARLYDQDGSSIQLGTNICTDPTTGEETRSRNIAYPYCPQFAPFGVQAPTDDPSPSVSPTASAASQPAPTAVPSRSASPSASR